MPDPPDIAAPPMTAAATASSSKPSPMVGIPAPILAAWITAAMLAIKPLRIYTAILILGTLMPASFAALSFPPIA